MRLRREGIHDKAAALETIMVGACWAPDRKASHNLIPQSENVCQFCGALGVDDYHQFWACPKLADSTWPEVSSTQQYVPKASAEAMSLPCLWLRGLLPSGLCLDSPVPPPTDDDVFTNFIPMASPQTPKSGPLVSMALMPRVVGGGFTLISEGVVVLSCRWLPWTHPSICNGAPTFL